MIAVNRMLPVAPAAVWDCLVDLRCWPAWGPSVRSARLDDGGHQLHPGATGRVQTAIGVWLPFRVTSWSEGADWSEGSGWTWSVASIPATGHRVRAAPPAGPTSGPEARCAATIDIPVWAPFYAPLCRVALGRLGRAAQDRCG